MSAPRLPAWSSTALRIAVSVAALAIVLARVPLRDVGHAFATLDPLWTLAAFGAVFAAIGISAVKWRMLLRARGYSIPLQRVLRHYFVGLFFNNFLPTSVGGDVVRAWDAGRDIDDAPEGAASVIAERLVASLALGLTAAIGLPFVTAGAQATLAVAVVIAASVGLVALFLAPARAESMMAKAMGGRFEGVADWVARAVKGVRETLRRTRTVLVVLALSVAFQVLVALVNFAIFRALGVAVSVGSCIVYTSVISAVTMVPISISGHGVREAGYVYFFGLAGVTAGVAVTASLLFFAIVALSTLPGALLFAIDRKRA